ncbi:AMP-binding protein [Pectobacteriaceae bacterium CE90]|nr:AMP-binding protein [Pectobacteriaceae bacterium CE90]
MTISIPVIIDSLIRHAQQTPERTALLCGDQHWNYRQLVTRAHVMASALQQAGLSGQAILLNLPKSLDAVAAMYATWLSGNHYIPIDYSQPSSRIERIIAAAAPALIIDTAWLATLDSQLSFDAEQPVGRVVYRNPIAAILYTSGSTGTPKGVQISHEMLGFFIQWAVRDTQLTAQDVLSNHASFAFDLSTFDLFASAYVGAATWIIRESEQKDCTALAQGLQRHAVSVWYSVPSILAMLEKSTLLNPTLGQSLRQVIFAGEPYPVTALKRLLPCLPQPCRVSNWYGPTETNVCVAYAIDRARLAMLKQVPIGLPLEGLTAQLEDENGDRHPLTAQLRLSGELLISGPCVTPGYSNVVVPRQAALHPRQCHATGDWVEMTPEGLVFRGRIDDMVKINGYRVELGEIESVLHQHPAIDRAALCVELGDLRQTLIMVISLQTGAVPPGLLELKQFLQQKLPSYMIPNKLVITESLPVNANGKVDRKQLAGVIAV